MRDAFITNRYDQLNWIDFILYELKQNYIRTIILANENLHLRFVEHTMIRWFVIYIYI